MKKQKQHRKHKFQRPASIRIVSPTCYVELKSGAVFHFDGSMWYGSIIHHSPSINNFCDRLLKYFQNKVDD